MHFVYSVKVVTLLLTVGLLTSVFFISIYFNLFMMTVSKSCCCGCSLETDGSRITAILHLVKELIFI